jgi:hypothetical protein
MALGMVPSDPDLASKAFADLKMNWHIRKPPGKQYRLKSRHPTKRLET